MEISISIKPISISIGFQVNEYILKFLHYFSNGKTLKGTIIKLL